MASTENFDPGRIRSARDRVFGVSITMDQLDPLRAILGDDWHTVRWYANEVERDRAFAEMRSEHRYSRAGDRPTMHYEKIDGAKPNAPTLPQSR